MQLAGSRQSFKEQGIGLIEVLVALLVIAIGVLGMAGVHTKALQHNQSAYMHSRATIVAGDILDRMRLNKHLARTSDLYRISALEHTFSNCDNNDYPDHCEIGSCTPEQMASYDMQQWKFYLNCELPGSTGAVSYTDVGDQRIYTIRIGFPDSPQRPASDLLLKGVL